jgi:hypothetical protein
VVVAAADTYLRVRDFSAEEVEGSGSILQGRRPGVGSFRAKVVGWCAGDVHPSASRLQMNRACGKPPLADPALVYISKNY